MGAPISASTPSTAEAIGSRSSTRSSAGTVQLPTPGSGPLKGDHTAASPRSRDVPRLIVDTGVYTGTVSSSSSTDLCITLNSPSPPLPPTTLSGTSKGPMSVSVPWKSVLEEAFKHTSLMDAILCHISSVPGGSESAIKILSNGAALPAGQFQQHRETTGRDKVLEYTLPSPTGMASAQVVPAWDEGCSNVSSIHHTSEETTLT